MAHADADAGSQVESPHSATGRARRPIEEPFNTDSEDEVTTARSRLSWRGSGGVCAGESSKQQTADDGGLPASRR